MFPVGDSVTVSVEARTKRLHPDGQDASSSSSKRHFTVAEGELDSSIHSDAGTVTCLGSDGKVRDRLIWRIGADNALDWEGRMTSFRTPEVSSTSASVSSTVDCLGDGPTRERRELFHNGKSKAICSTNLSPSENRRLDADLEVSSEVTLQRTGNVDRPVFSMRSDNELSGVSVTRNARYRHFSRNNVWNVTSQSRPVNDGYGQQVIEGHTLHSFADTEIESGGTLLRARYSTDKSCSSIEDESGSSCGDPSEDLSSEEPRQRCADTDASIPSRESLIHVDETDIQSARFSVSGGNCETPLLETKRGWEDFVEVRSAESSKSEVFKELVRHGPTTGTDGDENGSQRLNDEANDDAQPRPSYVLSSGRLSQEEVARLGRRPPTIDQDFEEYFSALML